MKNFILILTIVLMGLCGCTTTEKASTAGGLGGAVLGGIIGHQSGNDVAGAAIGGVVGAVGGMVVGEHIDKKFCPKCGREYSSNEKFCAVDGTELKIKEK